MTTISRLGVRTQPVDQEGHGRLAGLLSGLGAATFLAVYGLFAYVAVPWWLTCAAACCALVLAPSAEGLSRRLALNGCLLFGWTPLMWAVRWPVPVDHGAAVLAAAAAWLAVAGVHARKRPGGRRSLLPTVAISDSCLVLAVGAALATTHRLYTTRDPHSVLTQLFPGYDNVAHFNIFAMLLRHGTSVGSLGPAPDGTAWSYANYPQGFHAVAATLTEMVTAGPLRTDQILVAYAAALAAIVVLGCIVIAGAVSSLPGLGRRPLLCLPLVGIVLTAVLWQPGGWVIFDGFGNFWLAVVVGGTAFLVTLSAGERPTLIELGAVLGALLVVALNWMPLILLAWPVLLSPGFARRLHCKGSADLAMRVAMLTAAAVVALRAGVVLVTTVGPEQIIGVDGQIHSAAPVPALLTIVAAMYLCPSAPRWCVRLGLPIAPYRLRRMKILAWAPLTGIAVTTAMAVVEIRESGETSYYFFKLFMGVELMLLPLAVGVVGSLAGALPSLPLSRPMRGAASLVALAIITQAFGHLAWSAAPMNAPGRRIADANGEPLSWSRMAAGVLASTASKASSEAAFDREYMALGPQRGYQPVLPAAWFHSLSGSMSVRTAARLSELAVSVADRDQAAQVATELLRRNGGLKIVVAPQQVVPMRASVGKRYAHRIIGWGKRPGITGVARNG